MTDGMAAAAAPTEGIYQRLRRYVDWYVSSKGYTLVDDARDEMDSLAQTAVQKILGGGNTSFTQSQQVLTVEIDRTERAFATLIDAMIGQVDDQGDLTMMAPGQLTLASIRAVLGRLCPLWPFC